MLDAHAVQVPYQYQFMSNRPIFWNWRCFLSQLSKQHFISRSRNLMFLAYSSLIHHSFYQLLFSFFPFHVMNHWKVRKPSQEPNSSLNVSNHCRSWQQSIESVIVVVPSMSQYYLLSSPWSFSSSSTDLGIPRSSLAWGEIYSTVNGVPMHTGFHYHPCNILMRLKYCWKGLKSQVIAHPFLVYDLLAISGFSLEFQK